MKGANMRRNHNLALIPDLDLPRPNADKVSPAERRKEIATAMARLRAKIKARSEEKALPSSQRPRAQSAPSSPLPLTSEHRREQVEWLARVYGFQARKTLHESDPQLHLDIDPKLYWALRHQTIFPLDINEANPALLLRVPGFGVKVTHRIVEARKFRRLRFADLLRLKVPLERAKYFIKTDEATPYLKSLPIHRLYKQPDTSQAQLNLFAPGNT